MRSDLAPDDFPARTGADVARRWTLADALRQRYLSWAGVPVDYDIRRYARRVAAIDAIELGASTDDELRRRAVFVRGRAVAGEPLDDLEAEVFALAREIAARTIGLRPFDIQLAAGVALHEGRLVQLATGEGKTLVAVPAAVLGALTGRGVHIFTANDYLARRDAEWMGPVYRFFGLEAGFVNQDMGRDERRRAYAADVTYVTAKEAGFDFLRDHTVDDPARLVQRPQHVVIVDEADFILIDEARVPLVIAGPAPSPPVDHVAIAAMVRTLRPGRDYDTDEHGRTVVLTEAGMDRAGRLLGGVSLDDPERQLMLSGVHVALHAHALLTRDRDYIVRDGRIELVDEWTGRVADNRRWPHGIQPAVEAKEGLEPRPEGRILGSIPIQHFVRLYPKIAGMTATAVPAAEEFERFYGLRTVVFPPHRACRRVDEPDVVFTHREAKMAALAGEIERVHASGRPVLVGTASVGESEELAATLRARRVRCRVLNARRDAREARIVAHAGALGAVTISTNMAGRGTDIVLGAGDPAVREKVRGLGGLYVIGTNRHESRRIDDQLRGRAGRQGDPGSSRFFISLEDDLIERYGVVGLIPPPHRPSRRDGPVDDPVVRREIARGQRIVEGQNYEIRRTLGEYSQMVDEQRRIAHGWRQDLLTGSAEVGECREQGARTAPGAGRVGRARRSRRSGTAARHRDARSRLGRPSGAHRGHSRRHSPAALRRQAAGDRIPAADSGGVRRDDGPGA